MAEEEQNKTEEPTPYKIQRARQKGLVARGVDLGFLSILLGFSSFAMLGGAQAGQQLSTMMRRLLLEAGGSHPIPAQTLALIQQTAQQPIAIVFACGLTIAAVVILIELIQIRGIVFSGHPLKPDFNRLNPVKNLKRLFSARMLVETLKSIAKLVLYSAALFYVVTQTVLPFAMAPAEGGNLGDVWRECLIRLLLSFALIALLFAIVDQVISRREFLKQMRMSRSELNREVKEREGEPRQKQKRKRMHAEFTKQARALSGLRGADVLIVNPHHYAVGLKYDATRMGAPELVAKGRNRFALVLKKRAFNWSIITISDPPLARALYRGGDVGREIPPAQYRAVAAIYQRIRRSKAKTSPPPAKDTHAKV